MLREFSKDIWTCQGEIVSWYGMPYSTRMTIVPLGQNKLWVHSPVKICEDLLADIAEFGEPAFLVSPNKIHNLYLKEWASEFPNAAIFASPGLAEKRSDLEFDGELTDLPEAAWRDHLDQTIFRGSRVMEEVVFFHHGSKTLIVADLVENFPPDHFQGFRKVLAKLTGIVSPNGKMPLDWRLSFIFGKRQASQCFEKLMAWQPENLIVAHGECVKGNATEFLKKSFSWL